tara:strand:- start:1040 stop:1300 length:261 start_codon:yes stop_codon:yes gene_type:complete
MKSISLKQILSLIMSILIPSLLYSYYYPFLYNEVNKITKRGEQLDDKIDLLNLSIVFLLNGVILTILVPIIILILVMLKNKVIQLF